jgi:hypothetical protein
MNRDRTWLSGEGRDRQRSFVWDQGTDRKRGAKHKERASQSYLPRHGLKKNPV